MTKMAVMAINSKNLLKSFFSRTRRPMILKLGKNHQAIELYKVYINHDPGMTLTFFTARSTYVAMHLNGEKIEKCYRKLAMNEQMDRRFMFMKIFGPRGFLVFPCPGAIYVTANL